VDAGCSGEATGRFYRGGEGVERPVVELELMTTTTDVVLDAPRWWKLMSDDVGT
jgi:hypothetical protein